MDLYEQSRAFNEPSIPFKEYGIKAGQFFINCREAGEGLPVIFLETMRWGNRDFYDILGQRFHLFVLEFETAEVEDMQAKRWDFHQRNPDAYEDFDIHVPKEEGAEAAVREAARALAGDSYNLVGATQGANLALRTILRAPMDPEPAESLVLLSPNAIRTAPDLVDLDWVGWSRRLVADIHRMNNIVELPGGWELAPMFLPKESDAELEEWLPEIKCPTLVAFGTKDRQIAREAPATYRGNIPNCHISLIYDAAHLVAAERPQAVADVVIDFIENRETFVVNRHSSVINP